jgi:two-component system sensor histidine kinase MprB
VAIAILAVALVCYFVVRKELRGQVDDELRIQAVAVQHGEGLDHPFPGIPASAGGPAPYAQVVLADGSTFPRQGGLPLPVTSRVQAVAAGNSAAYMTDVRVNGSHLRELVFPIPLQLQGQTVAVQLARPLAPVDHVLARLRLILLVLCAGGVALAAALGRIAGRRVLAPLSEVTRAARHIGATDDLSRRIVVHADDEVGQLARSFNAMLDRLEGSRAALDQSVHAQRQLVADASHELRTPITSLRTNIEVLLANPRLGEEQRRRLLADVVQQSEELTALVGDLIELARGDLPAESVEEARLDRIAEESVARARRNYPAIRFVEELSPVTIESVPERVGRAINNLLDNAARHSPPHGIVEVTVDADGVTVRDHGPGIPPEELPHVFDRFFRGASSRGAQGSGLGLAIVRQVAELHGGSVSAANAPEGGAVFTLRLPALEPDAPSPPPSPEAALAPTSSERNLD